MRTMKKHEKNNAKSAFFHLKWAFLLLLPMLILIPACRRTEEDPDASSNPGGANNSAAGFAEENAKKTIQGVAGQTGRQLILLEGNEWTYGIPGFEDNSFSSITGEYKLLNAGKVEETYFFVNLSPEPLYFSGEWQTRRGTGNIQVYDKTAEEGFLAAAIIDDGNGTFWTAVFRFPRGLEEAGLSDDVFNQILRVWLNRCLYFITLAKTPRDISLPAVVEF